jgi:Methyltransferase domain
MSLCTRHIPDAPFEWLTSPASIDFIFKHIFTDALSSSSPSNNSPATTTTPIRVLHVGCGTSRLGEHLVEQWNVSSVLNVDVDPVILQQMQDRWKNHPLYRCDGNGTASEQRMLFEVVDYSNEVSSSVAAHHGPFDLIVDKSTLDCLLCTESAAAHLLQHVYNSLSSHGGIYLLITFHHVDFVRPLLEGLSSLLTGDKETTAWEVQSQILRRQVEDLRGGTVLAGDKPNDAPDIAPPTTIAADIPLDDPSRTTTTQWSSGSFEPDAKYHQFVNVFTCRKTHKDDTLVLSRHAVVEHVKHVCNEWWTQHNPILSSERISEMQQLFGNSTSLSLPDAYDALFTAAEKEHLDYDSFLEDWHSFLSTKSTLLDRTTMTLATAMAFLDEVQ